MKQNINSDRLYLFGKKIVNNSKRYKFISEKNVILKIVILYKMYIAYSQYEHAGQLNCKLIFNERFEEY